MTVLLTAAGADDFHADIEDRRDDVIQEFRDLDRNDAMEAYSGRVVAVIQQTAEIRLAGQRIVAAIDRLTEAIDRSAGLRKSNFGGA